MPACRQAPLVCPVHAARTDRVRAAYNALILASYTKREIRDYQAITRAIMLESTATRQLDDTDADTLARAARDGTSYVEQAKEYIQRLYGPRES